MAYITSTSIKNSSDLLSFVGANLPTGWSLVSDDIISTRKRVVIAGPSGVRFAFEAPTNPTSASTSRICGQIGGQWDPILNPASMFGVNTVETDSFYEAVELDWQDGVGLYEWTNFVQVHLFTHPEAIYVVFELKQHLFMHLSIVDAPEKYATFQHGQMIAVTRCPTSSQAATTDGYRGCAFNSQGGYPKNNASRMKIGGLPDFTSSESQNTFSAVLGVTSSLDNRAYDASWYASAGVLTPNVPGPAHYFTRSIEYIPPGGHIAAAGGYGPYGKTLAAPVLIWALNSGVQFRPVCRVPHIRSVNMKSIPPGFEFIDDGATYKVFPVTGKSTGSVPAGVASSGLCDVGMAYKT